MACGACNRGPRKPPAVSARANNNPCPKCKWPMRKLNKYNIKIRKMEPSYTCINPSCRHRA